MESRGFFNLFWGMQFRTCRKFWESTDSGLVLSQNFLQIQKPHRHYFDSCFATLANPADCRFCESQNLAENNPVRSTQTRPLRGAKNRIQGCRSATADFLLEAEKRGSPPKSEKAAAFWRVGGAGRGVQPFLREKISENNSNGFAESINESQSGLPREQSSLAMTDFDGLPRRFCESARNDEFILDSAYFIK